MVQDPDKLDDDVPRHRYFFSECLNITIRQVEFIVIDCYWLHLPQLTCCNSVLGRYVLEQQSWHLGCKLWEELAIYPNAMALGLSETLKQTHRGVYMLIFSSI